MAFSDDPRGSRRGQQGNGQFPPADRHGDDQRQPARQGGYSRQNDQYSDSQSYQGQRPQQPQQGGSGRQASFSAYRPEAYANNSSEKRPARPADRPEWGQQAPQNEPQFRAETPAPAPQRAPAADSFRPAPAAERGRPAHDPYYNAASDPYDSDSSHFDASASWNSSNYQEPPADQFSSSSNFYHHDEPPAADAQSMHNRFFAAEPEPEPVRAPPPPPPPAPAARYRQDDFDDFHEEERPAPRASKPAASAPSSNRGFDEAGGGDFRWDNFDQAPPPEAARPFANSNALVRTDEDLDADYFGDEDDYDGDEDFGEQKRGGGKKLMAAVLVGAVVTGGGLAYLYKAQTGVGENGEPPIIAANSQPIKERPTDPGGREFPNGSKLIYDRLDGGAGGDEPTRIAATATADTSGGDVPGVVTTGGGTNTSGTLEERIQNALRDARKQDEPAQTASAASLDTPRNVRTEVFRPDGSVDQSRSQRRAAPAEDAPVASAGRSAAPAAAPARQQVAAAAPAAPIATASAGGESGMFVQIAARNDQAAAMAAFSDLQQKYAGVLGNHSPSVRKVDLGEKGVWYRLMVGPMASKADADKLCEDLKGAGMKSCFSRKE